MEKIEKTEKLAQGADNQEIREKKVKFSASFTIRAVGDSMMRLKENGLINKDEREIVRKILQKAALRSMGVEDKVEDEI